MNKQTQIRRQKHDYKQRSGNIQAAQTRKGNIDKNLNNKDRQQTAW